MPRSPRKLPNLDALFLPLLARTERVVSRALEQSLGEIGVSLAQFRIVGMLLGEHEGIVQTELAKRLGVSLPTISVALGRLEESGLVERASDARDARARRVRLSERPGGISRAVACLEAIEHRALHEIPPEKLATAREVLRQIAENLARDLPAP